MAVVNAYNPYAPLLTAPSPRKIRLVIPIKKEFPSDKFQYFIAEIRPLSFSSARGGKSCWTLLIIIHNGLPWQCLFYDILYVRSFFDWACIEKMSHNWKHFNKRWRKKYSQIDYFFTDCKSAGTSCQSTTTQNVTRVRTFWIGSFCFRWCRTWVPARSGTFCWA